MKMKYLLRKHDLGKCCVVVSCILILYFSLFFGQGTSFDDILTEDEGSTIDTTTDTIVLENRLEQGYETYLAGDKVSYDTQGWTGLDVEIQSATYDAAGVTLNYFNTSLSYVQLDVYSGDELLVGGLLFYDTGSYSGLEEVEWIGELGNISLLFYISNYDDEFSQINLEYTIEGKSSNSLSDIPDDSTNISLDQDITSDYSTFLGSNLRNHHIQSSRGFTVRLHRALYPVAGVLVNYFDFSSSYVLLDVYSGDELIVGELLFSDTGSYSGLKEVEWIGELGNISLLFYISNYDDEFSQINLEYTIEGKSSNSLSDIPDDSTNISLDQDITSDYSTFLGSNLKNHRIHSSRGFTVHLHRALYPVAGVLVNYFDFSSSYVQLDVYSGDELLVGGLLFSDTGSYSGLEEVEWIGELGNISLLFYISNYDDEFSQINLEYTIEGKSSNSLSDIPDDSTNISLDQDIISDYSTFLGSNLRNYNTQGLSGFTVRLHRALYPVAGVLVNYFDFSSSYVLLDVYSGDELIVGELLFSDTGSYSGEEEVEWDGVLNNVSLLFYIYNSNGEFARIDIAYSIEGEALTNSFPGENENISQETTSDVSQETTSDVSQETTSDVSQENRGQEEISLASFLLPTSLVLIASVVVGCLVLLRLFRSKTLREEL